MVNNIWSSTATWANLATVSNADVADSTSVSAFNAWPASVQVNFVKANGTGTPPALIIGPDGGTTDGTQAYLVLSSDGSEVQSTPLPAKFSWYPDELTTADFSGWSDDVQTLYFNKNATFTTTAGVTAGTLTIGQGSSALTVTQPSSGAALSLVDVTPNVPTTALSAAAFFALTPSEQFSYLNQTVNLFGSIIPYSQFFNSSSPLGASSNPNSSDAQSITIYNGSQSTSVYIDMDGYSGFSTSPSSQNSSFVTTFKSWPKQVQQAYVTRYATPSGQYPATIVLSGSGGAATLATVASTGAEPDITDAPSSFGTWYANQSGTTIHIADFFNWPPAAQLFYVQKKASGGSTTLSGSDIHTGLSLTATLSTSSAKGFTLSATVSPGSNGFIPAVEDLDVLQLMSTADQAKYFAAADGHGTPKVVTYGGSNPPQYVATANTSGGVDVTAIPSAFSTAAASLDPATFLSWSPQVQNLYLLYKNTGSFNAAAANAATPTTIGSGTNTLSATFTGLSGTALIIAAPVQTTAGMDPTTIPYQNLPGSGADPSIVPDTAQALFPTLDGATYTIEQKPDGFNLAPSALDPSVFGSWHSALQLEYLRDHGAAGNNYTLTIGLSGGVQIHAFIGTPVAPATTGTKVYTVENLQKQDIAKMSLADQTVVANLFATGGASLNALAQGLGLVPNGVTVADLATARSNIQSQVIAVALASIQNPTIPNPNITPTMQDGWMPQADKDVFAAEVNNIAAQLQNSAVFSPTDIQNQINIIMTRYQRANAFSLNVNAPGKMASNLWQPESAVLPKAGDPSVSAYDDPTLQSIYGYKNVGGILIFDQVTFHQNLANAIIQQQVESPVTDPMKSVRDYFTYPNDQATANNGSGILEQPPAGTTVTIRLANGSTYNIDSLSFLQGTSSSKPASLDNNAAIIQSYQTFMTQEKTILQLQNKAIALATTGRITNQNLDLPNLIFLFQLYTNLTGEAIVRDDTEEVNETNELLKMYGAAQRMINQTVAQFGKDDGATATKGLVSTSADPTFPLAQTLFNTGNGLPPNPIETLKGITRPGLNLGTQTSTQWQQQGTSLSDTVTLINQDSQLKMNDINTMTKQKDRNFDLANNALSKMYDVLQKIAGTG